MAFIIGACMDLLKTDPVMVSTLASSIGFALNTTNKSKEKTSCSE